MLEVACACEVEEDEGTAPPVNRVFASPSEGDPGPGPPPPTNGTRECVVRTVPGTLNADDDEGLNTDDAVGLGGRGVE